MPSDLLTPFLEVERDLCKNFAGLEVTEMSWESLRPPAGARGFQRRHSLCPVTLPNSKLSDGDAESSTWAPQWKRESRFPRSVLSRIPFRTDRSVSMIEGGVPADDEPRPPPGLCVDDRTCVPAPASPRLSARYKTELCRTFEESGVCKYGAKCQFAHGLDELRGLSRHPKYKTEPCRTFHTIGFCPYGARCHFIHNAEELLKAQNRQRPPPLRHSLSFAGFPSTESCQPSPRPSSLHLARASSTSPSGSPRVLSPLFPEPGLLRPCPYAFKYDSTIAAGDADSALRFFATGDQHLPYRSPSSDPAAILGPPGLRRCSSVDSLSEEGYASSGSLSPASNGSESPGCEGRRLPIFSRLSVADE
ncbi:mRNA decay activator protein ZFP36L1 [Festucalex cinctus]